MFWDALLTAPSLRPTLSLRLALVAAALVAARSSIRPVGTVLGCDAEARAITTVSASIFAVTIRDFNASWRTIIGCDAEGHAAAAVSWAIRSVRTDLLRDRRRHTERPV